MMKKQTRAEWILEQAREIAFKRYKRNVLKGLKENLRSINFNNNRIYIHMQRSKTFEDIFKNFQDSIFYENKGVNLLSNMLSSFKVDIDI